MPHEFSYLINEKLNVSGKKIYCKVTGLPGTAQDGQPYVLVISGGPGFGHELTELSIKRFIPIADKEQSKLPHFIFFDNLVCGQSDKASEPEKEYTIDFFSELTAGLVEVVKEKLGLSQMRLCIDGGSFGSLVAMNFPIIKQEWLAPNSDIQMMQITSKVGPNGANMKGYTLDFLKKHHLEHFNYKNMIAAQEKLFAGDIKDQADYIQNFVLPMATLYAKNIDKSFLNKTLLTIVNQYPTGLTTALDYLDWLIKTVGLMNEELAFFNIMLGKCSLEVLNHFFKADFGGFNLIEKIKEYKHLYEKIPVCLITASKDHIVDYQVAQTIHEILPDTSALVIFEDAHMLNNGPSKNIFTQLNYSLLVSHNIEDNVVNHDILKHHLPQAFKEKLALIRSFTASNSKEEFTVTPLQPTNRNSFFANSNFYYVAAAVATTAVAYSLMSNS